MTTHLRSADFLDVASHPTITFVSSKLSTMDGKHVLHGDLTIRGVTNAVGSRSRSSVRSWPWATRSSASPVPLTINRHDYGVSWSGRSTTAGLVVAEEVNIEVNGEFIMESM